MYVVVKKQERSSEWLGGGWWFLLFVCCVLTILYNTLQTKKISLDPKQNLTKPMCYDPLTRGGGVFVLDIHRDASEANQNGKCYDPFVDACVTTWTAI